MIGETPIWRTRGSQAPQIRPRYDGFKGVKQGQKWIEKL